MKRTITKVLLILSSLIATMFIGEVFVRLYIHIKPIPTYGDKKFGWRATDNFYRDSILKDAEGKEYRAKVTTDDHGFRLFGNLQSKKVKVLVIGDSFTFAVDVSNDKTYYSLLAKKSKDMEFFAYGVSGYSTLQEFMVLDKYIDLIKPNIVILQLCTNDIFDNCYELEKISAYNIRRDRPYMDLQGNISYKNPGDWPYAVSMFFPHSLLVRFIATRTRTLLHRIIGPDDVIEMEIERDGGRLQQFLNSLTITKKIMNKIRDRASNSLIITFCADDKAPYYSELEQCALSAHFVLIHGIAATLKDYEQHGFTVKAADKYHWNELGHKIVADQIYEFLGSPLLRATHPAKEP